MLLSHDDSFHIAHLFNFLIQGEVLAFDCAKQQANLCAHPAYKKFLRRQARQEYFHTATFTAGSRLVFPKGVGPAIGQSVMGEYRELIEEALARGDLAESILGMQIVLEGLGDITLQRTNAGFSSRGLAFNKIRRIVLGQEDAHHSFGLKYIESQLSGDPSIGPHLKQRACDYFTLTDKLLRSTESLFEYFGEDANEYRQVLHDSLPDWVTV